jgi:hypothetical protein
VSLCQGGALQTCNVKAYKAGRDQRLYFRFGRLFLRETVSCTKNSTYTECGLEWQKKEGREKLVSVTRTEEIVIYSAKVN